MLVTKPLKDSALHVPVLLFWVTAVLLGGTGLGVVEIVRDGGTLPWTLVFGAAASLGVLAFTLSELRLIRPVGERLESTNVFGTKALPLSQVALGIRVTHSSRGGPTYTIYALAQDQKIDLAAVGSERRALALRERLSALLFGEGPRPRSAADAQRRVEQSEATWRANIAQSKAAVDSYYRSGKAKKQVLWLVLGVALYAIVVLAWFTWFNG